MNELYDLRDKLCDELKDQGHKGVSSGNIGTIDTLAHAIKNLDKIIMTDEGDEYSGHDYPYRHSYARGRSYASRDRMGRYSGADDKESIRREIKDLEDRLNKM